MKLAKADAKLFYDLMWGLQYYVNQQLGILPNISSIEEYANLLTDERVEVRDALWDNSHLIDGYLQDNPNLHSAEELKIVQKWKGFIAGDFYIYRLLKKHAIFIGGNSTVYGVLALFDPFDVMISGWPLPVMGEAVLLPFKGAIIYDGIIKWYSLIFGGGIRSSLHEDYMTAKQNQRIITSLEPELIKPSPRKTRKADKNWGPVIDDLVATSEKMKGGPILQSASFSLLRASALLAQAVVHNPSDLDEIWKCEDKVQRALSRFQTNLYRAE